MKLPTEKRTDGRVKFTRAIETRITAIDGTWSLPATLLDVAVSGARLKVEKPLNNLNLKEFFLVLSTTGSAYRRCELAWINGNEIGVRFLEKEAKPRKPLGRRE